LFVIAVLFQISIQLSLWLLFGLGVSILLYGIISSIRTEPQETALRLRFRNQEQFRTQFFPLIQQIGFDIDQQHGVGKNRNGAL
jgi:hypothetical protein